MKLNRIRIFIVVFLCVLAPVLQSCGDDEEKITVNNLTGTWQLILDEGYETLENRERESWKYDSEENEYYLILNKDGEGYIMIRGRVSEEFEWEIKNQNSISCMMDIKVMKRFIQLPVLLLQL
ncbi:MAG: hypothetical protein LUH15_20245 [Tannerellaceae bacterium]|nr:hypothetical protein [Tannerellaceae bacterium]